LRWEPLEAKGELGPRLLGGQRGGGEKGRSTREHRWSSWSKSLARGKLQGGQRQASSASMVAHAEG